MFKLSNKPLINNSIGLKSIQDVRSNFDQCCIGHCDHDLISGGDARAPGKFVELIQTILKVRKHCQVKPRFEALLNVCAGQNVDNRINHITI
ncbi:hypothetical protein Desal_1418 [Maridesulfovibrio salexigens DSM 2638]|uniref:Uncharacterized protein n=1 Tax=Maridesulfovibrio salexigens (strain ATCC 14822 / DSM 2638 / NCIMB 8403 / VKM B-1763) TaxID=526222 RepID=C6BRP0_MARSD|nr:hypothetical protein Desal_1418 [Maridesulfovibrio salexigens DSM 2638]